MSIYYSDEIRFKSSINYGGFSASFNVTVLSISRISAESVKSFCSVGQQLSTGSIIVTCTYSDGSKGSIPVSECGISGFDSSRSGLCTVTVSYEGMEATFDVEIVDGGFLPLIDGIYETDSTVSSEEVIEIGSYKGDFTLEHDVIINSMPQSGSRNKQDDSGFFLRFVSMGGNKGNAIGSGWSIGERSGNITLYWKDGKTLSDDFNLSLEIGAKYRFKYVFTNVGSGSGAHVSLTILDSEDTVIFEGDNLSLRNFTDIDYAKAYPITSIQIFNQANGQSTASVTISNAVIYGTGRIDSVNGNKITYSLSGAGNGRILAASYLNGALTALKSIPLEKMGDNQTITLDFAPDKVFMWAYDMYPIDFWEKED